LEIGDPTESETRHHLPTPPAGHFEINLDGLGPGRRVCEYEFVIDGNEDAPVADPFAEEITRLGGHRRASSNSGCCARQAIIS
jgi:hypothetical protein